MRFEKLGNGALRFHAAAEEKDDLMSILERCGGDDNRFLVEMLEFAGWEANGQLFSVRPEQVGALTEAPMLTDDCFHHDDGLLEVTGPIWWFPDYMLKNFAEVLVETGTVTFPVGAPALEPTCSLVF